MHDFISELNLYMALFSHIASIALVIGLFIANEQLKASRVESRIGDKRASRQKAIDAAVQFKEGIRLYEECIAALGKHNHSVYREEVGDFSIKSLSPTARASARSQSIHWVRALNEYEMIAAFFISGLADEEVGYRMFGRTFCDTVEHAYAAISHMRGNDGAFWKNTVDLYLVWAPRLKREKLDSSAAQISIQKASLPEEKTIPKVGYN